ncbi:MAG: MFS transporter [Leptothrix sp. (in: Bacteria)]|nr:MFS transporter [Leptothrix sp. (in: b-proteobacteria)]
MPPAPPQDGAVPRRLMPVLLTGVFMAALDTAVIAPAIPVLGAEFGLGIRDAGLLMVAFIMFSLPSTALLANLGDRHGRRPVFLASVALFALGSLVVALSPNFAVLLIGRAIQGMGGGGIIPTASAVIGDALPLAQRGRALGLIGAVYGMAFVLGPPLAAMLMVVASWHWVFLLNLPVAAVLLVMGRRALPVQQRNGTLPQLDVAGIVLVFALLACLVLGITRTADTLAGATLWPGLLLAAALLLPALVATERAVERRAGRPMIPLALFRKRQLRITYLLTAGAGFGMGGVIFLTSIATQAHGVAHAHAGFVLLPMVLCSMFGSVGAGRLLNRRGARSVILAGFALLGVGYGAAAVPGLALWGFIAATMPVGLGVGVVVGGALRTIAIDEAALEQRGAAQGLVNIFTSVGTLLSATVIGAVADFAGGGADGLRLAYAGVAALMALMLLAALALRSAHEGNPALSHGR